MAVNMLIPFVFDNFQICLDQLADLLQLPASESMGLSEQERLYPKFSVFLRAFNVNMHRLLSFPAEEEKPVSVMAENFGHRGQKSAEGMAARRGKRKSAFALRAFGVTRKVFGGSVFSFG